MRVFDHCGTGKFIIAIPSEDHVTTVIFSPMGSQTGRQAQDLLLVINQAMLANGCSHYNEMPTENFVAEQGATCADSLQKGLQTTKD